ncbi:hypothetical protein WJX79_002051 [Trebouxia sp. C0005]
MTQRLLASNWGHCQMSHIQQKAELRKVVKQGLRKLTAEEMAAESLAIAQNVLQSQLYHNSKTLGIYLHCAKLREVDTTLIVAAAVKAGSNKECFVPMVEDQKANMQLLHLDSLEGLVPVPPFSILEPTPTYPNGHTRQDVLTMGKPLEVLLMPGLAFDGQGHRLGRGGGYYDNFVNKCKQRAKARGWQPPLLVALAFEAQLVHSVPTAPHDIDVDILATAKGFLACSTLGEEALSVAAPLGDGGSNL